MLSKFAEDADVIIGPDARGFIFGVPVATKLKKPFVMVKKGQKVVIIDDLMATGGTTKVIIDLLEKVGAIVIRVVALIELVDLKGKDKINGIEFKSILKY